MLDQIQAAGIWLKNVVFDKGNLITMIDFRDWERQHLVYDIVAPLYSAGVSVISMSNKGL
ncbi:hypothetical protein ACP8HI_20335 [Paenibacillus sp. FA6]|uniref:hypothetical protein n=1 Tax=Paenibacillus sp. FA6 TaxID=3413029 RepID=UPI003F65AA6B